MFAFILRRLLQSVLVLLAVGVIAFALFRLVGDPINQIVSLDTPAAERERIRLELGLDDPSIVQFGRYLARAATLDFGISYQFRQPVAKLIGERMPATLELAIVAALLSLIVGIPMGVYTALRRGTLSSGVSGVAHRRRGVCVAFNGRRRGLPGAVCVGT